jgi:hypothetical protein
VRLTLATFLQRPYFPLGHTRIPLSFYPTAAIASSKDEAALADGHFVHGGWEKFIAYCTGREH